MADRTTYLITSLEIQEAFGMRDYMCAVEDAFGMYAEGTVEMPPKVYLTFEKGDLRCMPAHIRSMKLAGVKNVNVHPENKDVPVVMATVTLVDTESGFCVAIMDGTHITKMRTGAAGAVAAKYLSREDSKVAAFIGTGTQARTQLEALVLVRPRLAKVILFDLNEAGMSDFGGYVNERYGLEVAYGRSVGEAVKEADIVVTTTPSRTAVVDNRDIKVGTHINAIGADAAGKQELDPQILKRARIVIDSWE